MGSMCTANIVEYFTNCRAAAAAALLSAAASSKHPLTVFGRVFGRVNWSKMTAEA
jgi:hypothetical protein